MAIENGDFVKLEFTGKVKETEEVFDTTSEEIANETDLYTEGKAYGPIPIIVGGNHLLPAIEKAIVGLEEGDTKTIEVTSEEGFGNRNPKLISLLPMKEFKKQGMTPYPGMKITSDGQTGKILTVSGGRVRVDFNHELAGKDLVYDLAVVEIIEDDIEKIKSMVQLHYSYPNMDLDKTEVTIEDKVATIKLDEVTKFDQKSYMDITLARFKISKDIWSNMDIDKVNFVDEFEKKLDEETEEEKTEE